MSDQSPTNPRLPVPGPRAQGKEQPARSRKKASDEVEQGAASKRVPPESETANAGPAKSLRQPRSTEHQTPVRSRLGTVRPKASENLGTAEKRPAASAQIQQTPTPRKRKTRSSKPVGPDRRVSIDTQQDLHGQPQSWSHRIGLRWNSLSSMMVSMIFHSLLLVVLALMTSLWPEAPAGVTLDALMVDVTTLEQPENDTQKIEIELPEETEVSPIEMDQTEIADDVEEMTPSLTENNDLSQSETMIPVPAEPAPVVDNSHLPTGGGLEGRNAEARAQLAADRGGSPASEDAVELGLKWLAAHQRIDGSWRLDLKNTPCQGRCQHSGSRESSTAATGLALMAFLGAGYTHKEGPYQDQVERGLQYLRSKIRISKFGGSMAEPTMYSHAIATMAIGEAYALTGDTQLHSTLEAAMKYIVSAQHQQGGWRYNPQQPGDMTVTGWQIMALKSCELAGLEVPKNVWESAEEFVVSLQSNYGSSYGYNKPGEDPTPTAVGLLARMYMGWGRNNLPLREGAARLAGWGPSKSDIYFDYYTTLVLHHLNDQHWEAWNGTMRDYLVATQDRRGHQKGSWHFKDKHGSVGGRLYTTAMAIMILEVYYRYLPLYEKRAVDHQGP